MVREARKILQLRLRGFDERGDAGGDGDASPNSDLVGRGFSDGTTHVRVLGVSATNPAHVIVERERDRHAWTIHAGVVRLIVGRTPRRRRAA